jgi:hypothetical protein
MTLTASGTNDRWLSRLLSGSHLQLVGLHREVEVTQKRPDGDQSQCRLSQDGAGPLDG